MNESLTRDDALADEAIRTLLALPEESQAAYVAGRAWQPAAVVRALADRSFALLEGDPAQALDVAAAGARVAAMTDNAATRALSERAMANALHASGRYAAALERYDAAWAAFSAGGAGLEAARTLIGKVDALMMMGRYAEALAVAQAARAALAAHDDHRRVARLDSNLGNIFHRLDRPAEALVAYERARSSLLQHGDELDVARVDWNRGNVLANLNRFDAAFGAYAAAQVSYRAHGRDAEYARTAYNVAYLHFLRGHYGLALAELAHVRAVFARIGDRRWLALCDLDEAEVLLALNRLCEAFDLARQAGETFDALALHYEAAKARTFCAISLLERGDLAAAEVLVAEADRLFAQEGNTMWMATMRLLAANLDLRRGDPNSALAHCDEALRSLAQEELPARMGRGRVLRGQALHALGQHDDALADALAASASATAMSDHVLSYQAFHLLGRLQDEAGDLEGAAASFLRAIDEVDLLRGNITRDDLRISFMHDKVALYEDMVRVCLKRGRLAEAFAQVERARARALVDLLARGPGIRIHADGADVQLAARIEELRAELSALYNRLHGEGEERQCYAEGRATLLAQMRRHEDELVAALATLQTRQADYVSLQGASTVDLAQMPPRLGPHEVLLEYYLLGDDVMAFIVTDGTVRVYGPLTSRARVEDLVQRWWFHLAHFRYGSEFVRRHDASLRATALDVLRSLHTSIIAPLEADLEGRTVVLVPHGPLHHVPFHALHDGHRFMIERHAISYAPSATVLTLQRVGATARDGTLIVGVPTPALPHIIEEVAAVKACHSDAHVLVGAEATRARVVAAAAGCRRIHLATHAVFRADNPIFSAVQLGDDWLTVSDIYNLDLAADLVVLSGCDTGTSVVHQGDELIGLTRGFLYAGARALVVSLWAVSDAATADLMRTFYQSLAGGSDACQALRLAQREAMVRNPHPYYWAPFIAWGQCTTASARDVPDTHG